MDEVDKAFFAVSGRLEQNRAGTIAEDDARGAVFVIDDGRHDVGTDHQNFFVRAAMDELNSRLQGVNESRARR